MTAIMAGEACERMVMMIVTCVGARGWGVRPSRLRVLFVGVPFSIDPLLS